MAGGGDLGFYIGSYTSDANATAFLTGRGYTQARGYIYWDSVASQLKVWDGSAWGVVTGAGAVSPWTESPAGMIYPIDYSTDDVAVGTNAMAGTERFRVVGNSLFNGNVGLRGTPSSSKVLLAVDDLDDAGTTYGADIQLDFGGSGTKPWWAGCVTYIGHTGTGAITTSIGFLADAELDTSGGSIDSHYGFFNNIDIASGTTITDAYGFYAETPVVAGTLTNSYGIYIADQNGGTLSYGIYQEGADDVNVFMGKVGVNKAAPVSASYVEVLDDDESNLRVAFNASLEKNAAGSKGGYIGFRTTANLLDGSSSLYGFQSLAAVNGGDSSSSTGFYSSLSVASGDTVTTSWGLHLEDVTGAGTITTAYGIDIEDQGLSSTTTYGIYIGDQSGTTAYGIYQAGTDDKNVLMGQVGINQTTFAGTNYVEVLDNEESATRYGYVSTLEKNAAGAKTGYLGFSSGGSVDAGSVSGIQHFKAATTTAGGSVTSATGYYSVAVVGSGDTVTTQRGLWLGDATGSGTITTAYGMIIEDQGLSSTTTYGIYIGDQSGTTAYGIYQAGANDINVFMGITGVGIEPNSSRSQLKVQRTETVDLQSDNRAGLHVIISYDPASTGYDIYDYRAIDIDIWNLSTDTTCDIERAYGVYVNSPSGQGGDIEFAAAFYCEDMGLDSDVLDGWGVYLNGSTTRNYMAGVLGAKNATPSNSHAIDAGDNINIATGKGLCVGGIQVVTDQQAAIGDISDTSGSDQDTACRVRINSILAALRTHGLIDT